MTPSERHALEKLLADVAGVEVRERVDYTGKPLFQWEYDCKDSGDEVVWEPLTDANQMMIAKAGLRKAGYGYSMFFKNGQHHVSIWRALPIGVTVTGDPSGFANHENELVCFGLAIKLWKESGHGHSDSAKSSD